MAKKTEDAPDEDYMIPGPRVGPRKQVFARFKTGEQPDVRVWQEVREGENLDESAVLLTQRGDSHIYDVEPALRAGDGPAQVATETFRTGWDRIFGGKQTIGIA